MHIDFFLMNSLAYKINPETLSDEEERVQNLQDEISYASWG